VADRHYPIKVLSLSAVLPYKWTGCGTRFNSIGFGHLRRRYPGLLSGELIAACRKKPAAP
jgi:hypothetical protein